MQFRLVPALALLALLVSPGAGLGWVGPTNLTWALNAADGDFFPDVVGDSLGNVHVVWCSSVDSANWQIYHVMRYPAGNWSGIALVGGSSANWVRAAVDSSNNLHVAWHGGPNQTSSEVYYRKRSSAGSWGSIANIANTSGQGSLFPDIACDGLGRVFVAWHDFYPDSGGWDIAMARFEGSWQPIERLTTAAVIDCYPVLACDASNTLHLAWSWDYQEIYYRTRSTSGTWSGAANISNNSGSSRDPGLAVSPGGVPHVVWHDNTLGNWEEFYATKAAGAWQSPVNLSNDADATDCYGSVCVSGDGSVNVVWQDYTNTYFARNTGSGFGGRTKLYTGQSKHNAVCADSDFDLHIVWQDKSPGDWDILYMTQDYPDQTPPSQVANALATGSDSKVYLSWKNPTDLDYRGTIVCSKAGGFPTGPADGQIYNANVPGANVEIDQSGLTNGVTRYYAIYTYDTEPNYSAPVTLIATPQSPTARYAKGLADGSSIDMNGKTITAVFSGDGCIYVEEPNRTSGIRVVCSTTGLAVGDTVDIRGAVGTRLISGQPAERQINATSVSRVTPPAYPPAKPLAMNCRAVGGVAVPPLLPGVKDGIGLNNMGLLVRISGKVTMVIGSTIYVDDGTNIPDVPGRTGVMVKLPGTTTVAVGDIVSVTGIVEGSIPAGWTANRRYVHTRDWNDFRIESVIPTEGAITGAVSSCGPGISGARPRMSTWTTPA